MDSLPQLYSFVNTIGPKLAQPDRLQIYEAIAYIISSMPVDRAATSLRTFAFELLEKIHVFNSTSGPSVTKDEIRSVEGQFRNSIAQLLAGTMTDILEQLEVLLEIVDTFGEELPSACQDASTEAWRLFDPLLRNHGSTGAITERVSRVLRFGIQFFGVNLAPLVPSVLERLTLLFEQTGFSSCMWIAGKLVQRFGNSTDVTISRSLREMFERVSAKTVLILQTADARTLPDGRFNFFYANLRLLIMF